jgi:hypothetical protein
MRIVRRLHAMGSAANRDRVIVILLLTSALAAGAQSLPELRRHYTGKTAWNPRMCTLTFISTGQIRFKKPDHKRAYWDVPPTVKRIVINRDVTVTGAFHTRSNCTITGRDRKTSKVFGTDERAWANNREIRAYEYCQFQNRDGILRVQNLTCLNPFAFFIRGWGKVNHVENCDFIDNRGGWHNHSDGFSGGDGSTVKNCYFECGDDVFKAYFSYTVTDCTVKMIQNSVPIQLGWGDYSDGAVCTFKNLTIVGDRGRGNHDNAVIVGTKGRFGVTINIDGCRIVNPNAALVSLEQPSMTLNGAIGNARIAVNKYWCHSRGKCSMTINGSREKTNVYGVPHKGRGEE